MKKRGHVSIYGILLTVVFAIALTNTGIYFILDNKTNQTTISGLAIENSSESAENQIIQPPARTNKTSQFIIIIEWTVLVLVILAGFAFEKMHHKKEDQNYIELHLPQKEKGKTDLDLLYDLLKEKKKIKVWAIAKLFNVSEDIVLEWARILEAGNLALLNYPKFGDAEVALIENSK